MSTRPWLVALGLALATTVSNGFARFAYGLILPAMREDLAWSYTEAGWINTANALGYLAGAVLGLRIVSRVAPDRLLASGVIATALALLASAATRDFALLMGLRIVAGVGGALAFIAGAALAAGLFRGDASRNALALAIYFGGGAPGLILAGAVLPLMLERTGAAGWPWAWGLMGAASLAMAWPAIAAARAAAPEAPPPSRARLDAVPMIPIARELAGYFGFAVGYIVYLTFLVAWMRAEGADPALVSLTWSVLGLGSLVSPLVWRGVLARSSGGGALALSCAATGLATLLPLAVPGTAGLLLSAALFGVSFLIVPTAATSFARKNLDPARLGTGVALFTVVFATGQTIGPVAAGALADLTDDVATGLAGAGLVLIAGAAAAAGQRPVAPRRASPTPPPSPPPPAPHSRGLPPKHDASPPPRAP